LISPLRERRAFGAGAPEAELSLARREREALYEAIRDLDHDFETGKVASDDHTRLSEELRARAAALLAQERAETGSSAPHSKPGSPGRAASEASVGTCPACGIASDPSHRFCAQCGAALAAPRGAA
jgi:hypothetical protein